MTYRRCLGTVEAAGATAMHELPPALVEKATGVSTQAIYDAINPTTRKQLSLRHAAHLDAALISIGRPEVFGPLFDNMRQAALVTLEGRPARDPVDLRDRIVALSKELGDVSGGVTEAMRDAVVTDAERAALCAELRDLIHGATAMIGDLERQDRPTRTTLQRPS